MQYSTEKRLHDAATYGKLTGEQCSLAPRNTCCRCDVLTRRSNRRRAPVQGRKFN